MKRSKVHKITFGRYTGGHAETTICELRSFEANVLEVIRMKRMILVVLSILAVSAVALAQAPAEGIDKALLAAPGNLKAGATVIKWKADYTYDTLRKGTNKMVCYDRSGQPGQQAFAVECTSLENLPRVGNFVIAGKDNDKPRADLQRPWALVSKRADLAGLRLHDLRHSFASVGAGSGFGLPVIGKLLGHSNSKTTERYAHLAADPLRRASDAISGSIAKAMGEPAPSEPG